MKRRMSAFATAVTVFFAINVTLSFFAPFNFDPFKFPYRGWAWWTFDGLRKATAERQEHNVALLGSSLMVSAVTCCDANFLNRDLDLTQHHGAEYFDHVLQDRFGGSFKTYNLSAPGQMPSDAFLTLKGMLATANRPDVVIYGVAPRDFIDSSLSNPTDTEPFRFLNRLVNTDDCAGGLFRDPLGKLQWFVDRNLYFAHHAMDIQLKNEEFEKKFLAAAAPLPYGSHEYSYWQRTQLLPRYKTGEIYPNAISTHPATMAEATEQFRDNTAEYMERYKNPDSRTYKTQFYFLSKLAELCRKERIELVIVNMPISKENITVLKPANYLYYIASLQRFAREHNMRACWDLNDFTVYNRTDYHDFVHLNAFGGTKFFNFLTERLYAETETNQALKLSGMTLHQRQGFAANPAIDPNKVQQDLQNILGPLEGKGNPVLDLHKPGANPGPLM
ncbi:MAG: hypothetical protein JSS83_16780 [Cyanobacteria bacterium SZAS LIN-3]|nr:hypothetical protein [Cyanobacteria bacterium SZAS LIN-3]